MPASAAGTVDGDTVRGSDIIAAIKRCGIAMVVALPDIVTSDGLLWPIARDPALRLVRVCKEDEGVSICAGLSFTGTRSLLLMQHTGFLDSINAIRAVAVEYALPVCMIVGLQGMEPDRTPPQSDKCGVRIVEPLLDLMGIDHARLGARGDEARIAPAFNRAWEVSRPFVFLATRAPE
jgi:sulfopyruvate decarboxylase subunit beta